MTEEQLKKLNDNIERLLSALEKYQPLLDRVLSGKIIPTFGRKR